MKRSLFIAACCVSLLGVLLIAAWCGVFYQPSTPASDIGFSVVDLDNDNRTVTLSGHFVSSGMAYRDYSYRIVDDALVVSIRGGLVTRNHSEGSFGVVINDSRLIGAHRICIQNWNTVTQIYPK